MKTTPGFSILLAAVLLSTTAITISSSQEISTGRPTFEVATVKPSSSAREIGGPYTMTENYFAWSGRSLRTLIRSAYRVRDWQIEGGPDWMNSQLWDVEGRAKAEGSGTASNPGGRTDRELELRMLVMLQSLLEDRFKLKIQHQTKESPVYNLVVAKGGPKIKLDEDQTPLPPPGTPNQPSSREGWGLSRGTMMMGWGNRPPYTNTIQASAVPIARLISNLLYQAGRPIIDQTNLKGLYTFKIQWSEEDSGSADSPLGARRNRSLGPAFFTALQEQLGLRLESAKGPVEFLVIKSAQKPSGN